MQFSIFRKGQRGKKENINLSFALCFFLFSSLISFSLIGCGGGGGGGGGGFLPASEGTISPALFSGWQMTKGPFSGSIPALAVDPIDSEVIYSITRKSEVYKSIDGGLSWIFSPTMSSETREIVRVLELEIAPTDNQVLYLGTGSQGMYKSNDGGNTWIHISGELPKDEYGDYLSVDQILVDSNSPDKVYIRLNNGSRIYITTNGGQNWSEIYNGASDLDVVKDLVIDPTNPDVIYIGQKKKGVWKSIDGGQNWTAMNNGLPVDLGDEINITELSIDHQEPFRVYAGTAAFGLFRTDDGGESWGYIYIYSPVDPDQYQEVLSLEVDPNNHLLIYVGIDDRKYDSRDGLWITTDGGLDWTHPFESVGSIKIAPSDSTVFVHLGGWYKRSEPTEGWQQINFRGIVDVMVNVLSHILPFDSGFIYAGTELGVYITVDGGENWEPKNQGLEDQYIYTLVMDPNDDENNTVYIGTADGVYKTEDGGGTWEPKNGGLTAWGAFTLAMDPIQSDILYVGTTNGIFKTDDGGENWIEKGVFPYSNNFVWRLAIAPDDHLVLYASVEDWFGTEGKIYKSSDGGESWQEVSNNLPTDIEIWGIAISPTSNNIVYIGINGYGIYKTIDGGETWELKNSGLVSTNVISLVISQMNDTIVFTGTDDKGVFATIDGGKNWVQNDKGLTCNLNKRICSLAMDVRDINNPVVYAGTGCGVFKAYK